VDDVAVESEDEGEDAEDAEDTEDAEEESDADATPLRMDAGLRAAMQASMKQCKEKVRVAKDHTWKPKWLAKHNWLRTVPAKTQAEWEATPKEGPECL